MSGKGATRYSLAVLMGLLATTSVVCSEERSWVIRLEGLFRGGTKPLYLYARERDGQWIAIVGSSRDPDREGGKTYNRSWYCGELPERPIADGRMKGRFTLHMTPDLQRRVMFKGDVRHIFQVHSKSDLTFNKSFGAVQSVLDI